MFSFVSNLMHLLNSMVLSIIIARFLGPKNLGIFHLVLWTVGIAMLFVNLGIVMSLKKHVAEYAGRNDHRSIAGLINFLIRIRITVAVAVTSFLIIYSGTIAGFFGVPDAQQ